MEPSLPLQTNTTQIMNIYKGKEESSELNHQKYKELISKLHFQITPRGCFYLYEGFWHPKLFLEGTMYLQDNFVATSTDILLCSTMKSGTTWLKALVFAIVTRKRFNLSSSPLCTTMPQNCIPTLEVDLVPNSRFERDPKLPLLSTHIPYASLPESIITSGCKIVYIYREPKDVFVSLWHFWCKIKSATNPIGLHECFELFAEGVITYGPFWDHVLSYWEASLERPGKILIVTYEDLLTDTEFYVKKLAEFVDFPFSVEEQNEGEVEKIVKFCNFENLSNLDVNKTGKVHINSSLTIDNNIYFRKGQIGDWKNYMTAEMADRLDKMTATKFGGRGLIVSSKTRH